TRSGNDLVISVVGTTDSITLKDCFTGRDVHSPVERFQFADGTVWDVSHVVTLLLTGTEEANTITGFSSADTISALGGNDTVFAGAGDDTVDAGAGSDTIYGEAGDDTILGGSGSDTLIGGAGNDILLGGDDSDTLAGGAHDDILDGGAGSDYLYGGSQYVWEDIVGSNGNDRYLFGRGSGLDTVRDLDTTPGNVDTIQLTDDITPVDVTLERKGENLVLSIKGTADRLVVEKWFWNDSTEFQVEEIRFADGTTWDVDTVKQMVLVGTAADDLLLGYATADTIQGHDGSDTLYGRAGDDLLEGGAGWDRLYGDAGNDTLRGGDGQDRLEGGAGDDILEGGAGRDYLYGGNSNYGYDWFSSNGNDTYLLGRESDQDIVEDYDRTFGNVDTILVDADVSPEDVTIRRTGNNLVVSIN
ncbi:MAG: calcium-binding protein, partial [Thermodesulfobacteriota bacterium]